MWYPNDMGYIKLSRIILLFTIVSVLVGITIQLLPQCWFLTISPGPATSGMHCNSFAGSIVVEAIGTVTSYIPLFVIFALPLLLINLLIMFSSFPEHPFSYLNVIAYIFGLCTWSAYIILLSTALKDLYKNRLKK
jgi:hypothetical protein